MRCNQPAVRYSIVNGYRLCESCYHVALSVAPCTVLTMAATDTTAKRCDHPIGRPIPRPHDTKREMRMSLPPLVTV